MQVSISIALSLISRAKQVPLWVVQTSSSCIIAADIYLIFLKLTNNLGVNCGSRGRVFIHTSPPFFWCYLGNIGRHFLPPDLYQYRLVHIGLGLMVA